MQGWDEERVPRMKKGCRDKEGLGSRGGVQAVVGRAGGCVLFYLDCKCWAKGCLWQ